MKPLAGGKTNHCGHCRVKRLFWLVDDQYCCEVCGLVLVPAEKVVEVANAAFDAYRQHYDGSYSPPPQTAVDAAHAVWNGDAADFDEDEQYMARMGTGQR